MRPAIDLNLTAVASDDPPALWQSKAEPAPRFSPGKEGVEDV
jgi:hypothetical protein